MKKSFKQKVISAAVGFSIIGGAFFGAAGSASAATTLLNPLASKTYNYSSQFGARCIPTLNASSSHPGQDLSASDGSDIRSIADGTVYYIQNPSGNTTSGKVVVKYVIDGTTYYVAYLHMWTPGKYVKVGQKVSKGQHIADVGSSGPSTGAHLHLEIWKGAYQSGTLIDPTPFMKSHGVDLKAQAKAVTYRVQPAKCTYYATGSVSLRSSANSTSSVVTTVSKGTVLTANNVLSSSSGNYRKVTANGKTGWLYKSYVSPSYIAPVATKTTANIVYKTNDSVNFRTGPSSSYSVIKLLAKGTTATTTGKASGAWYQVKVGSTTGWVSSSYLTKSTVSSTASAVKYTSITKNVKYKTNSSVNFRKGPATSYASIKKLAKSTAVTTTGRASGSWYEVKVGSTTGWVYKTYLTKVSTTTKAATATSKTKTTKANVNYRSGAGTSYKSYGVVKKGTKVSITGKTSKGWYQVKYNGKTAWIAGSYLK